MKNNIILIIIGLILILPKIYCQNTITIKGAGLTIQKGMTISEVGNIDISDNLTNKGELNNSGIIGLKGNLTNNTKSEILGSGEFQITGTDNQYIKGNNTIGSLTINKSQKDLTLNGNLTVTGQIKFIKGLINTSNSSILTLGNTAIVYGASTNESGANDQSYVNGPMIKLGKTNFIFPVGKNTSVYPLHPISLEISGTTDGSYQAEYVNNLIESPEMKPSGVKYISQTEYWSLSQISGNNKGYITLGLRNISNDLNNAVVLNYDNVSNTGWENAGNTGSKMLDKNDGLIRSGLISRFTKFTYGSVSEAQRKMIETKTPSNLNIKVYPNPSDGKDINLDIDKK